MELPKSSLQIVSCAWADIPERSKINTTKLDWKKYSKHSGHYDFGNTVFPESNGLSFRVIVIRTYRKNKTIYYPICTNLTDWKDTTIVKAYRGRQIVENMFKETNQAFYSNKLPSMKFLANKAYLWFIVLAYNQFFFFQKHVSQENIKDVRLKNFRKCFSKSRVR